MRKRKIFAVLCAAIVSLSTGITAFAANCPACEASGVQASCISNGTHLWHSTTTHTVAYSEGGVLKTVQCTVTKSEDSVTWSCPRGHGTVFTQRHYVEKHSCNYCTDLDYYH